MGHNISASLEEGKFRTFLTSKTCAGAERGLTHKVGEERSVVEDALEARVRVADHQRVLHVPWPILELHQVLVSLLHGGLHIIHPPHTILVDRQPPERAVCPEQPKEQFTESLPASVPFHLYTITDSPSSLHIRTRHTEPQERV